MAIGNVAPSKESRSSVLRAWQREAALESQTIRRNTPQEQMAALTAMGFPVEVVK